MEQIQIYSYMNMGKTSMSEIPTTVTASGVFLKKCMNDPDGKIARENAERNAKEKKAEEQSISATGNGVRSVTQSVISGMSVNMGAGVAGFDVKA